MFYLGLEENQTICRIYKCRIFLSLKEESLMLQNCQHLEECEVILAKKVQEVTLLGEGNLMPEDVRILRNMLKDAMGGNLAKGTALLRASYPRSLAYFLVGMGIYGYKDGDYWPAVEDAVGKLGPRIRGEWGNFFLAFLK
jgi:hypothetical protein